MENIVETLIVQLIGDLSNLSESGDEAQIIIDRITAGQEVLEQAISNTTVVSSEYSEVVQEANKNFEEMVAFQQGVAQAFEESEAVLNKVVDSEEVLKQATDDAAAAAQNQLAAIQENVEATDELTQFTEGATNAFRESQEQIDNLVEGSDRLSESLSQTGQASESLEINQHNLGESLQYLRQSLANTQEINREVRNEYARLGEELERTDRRAASIRNLVGGLSQIPGPAGTATRTLTGLVGSVNSFVSASGPMIPAVLAIGAGLTAVLGPAAAVYLAYRKLNREMEELDRVAKKAESLGDSVGSLQSLSFALKEIAGMSEGQTENALMRLQRAVGGAADGAGEGSKAFKKLGLDVQQLNQMTPTEQFRAVADAFQSYGSHAEKARMAQQLFGRGSQEIVLALMAEKAVLEESEEWARKYGLTISSVDSESIQRANDALGRVGDAIGGWITQLAAEFAPLFEVIANHLLAWIPPATMFNDAMRFVVDLATVMLGILTDVGKVIAGAAKILMGDFKEGFELMKEGFSADSAAQFLYESEQARKEAEKATAEKEKQRATQQELNRELEKQAQLEERASSYVEELRKQYEFMAQEEGGEKNKRIFEMQQQKIDPEIITAAKEFESKIAEIEEKRRVSKENLNRLSQEGLSITKEIENATKRGLALDEQFKSDQEKAIDRAEELKDLFDRGLIRPETFQRGIEELNSGLNQATQEANRFWEAMNGPQLSQFGRGREGLEESLIGIRGEARGTLLKAQGFDPRSAEAEGMRLAREEATRPRSEVDKKLLSVLDLLEKRLSKGEDPNTLKLQVIEDLT